MEDIDYDKTLARNRLSYKTHWQDFIEVYMVVVLVAVSGILVFLSVKDSNTISFLEIISFDIILVSLAYYKNELCRELIKVETGLTKDINKNNIIDFLIKKDYLLKYSSPDYIRVISKLNFMGRTRELTIIFMDNYILINLINKNSRLRWPAIRTLARFIHAFKELTTAGT